ncbi:MAG: VOC family protein [Chloroflexi bacterium]|nr:MAG: VOC family protein [Chloroflexota bacterium]
MSTEQQQASPVPASIHPGTHIGLVTLRVSNLEHSRHFYEDILAFQPIEHTSAKVVLGGQDKQPLLALVELPGAAPQPRRATGLHHVAILLPTRADLGRQLLRLARVHWQHYQEDHLVSEALYISDADGNGLEMYRGLAEAGRRYAEPWEVLPAGTRIGHMHLRAADIKEAERFYHTILGFDVTCHFPGAIFLSADHYHHHIGLNTWHSLGAQPAPEHCVGLQSYAIVLPTREALQAVKERLAAHDVAFEVRGDLIQVHDPWYNQIIMKVEPFVV